VLNCLEKIATQAERAGSLNEQDARDAASFFRAFADKCHHGKEGDLLFPALEAKGFPRRRHA
jgi:hemerythrin-like domain-containing protein